MNFKISGFINKIVVNQEKLEVNIYQTSENRTERRFAPR